MLYKVLKLLIKPVHRLFYKKIIVEGKENIPDGGVIFTPNHQNALMDALAIITTSGRSPYFLARADMFTKAFYRAVLRLLRVVPVYRKSDGTQSLDRNKEVFSRASRLLTRNKSLAIFPEAGHNDKNRLQALRKGFVRVGFQAEEYASFEKSIAIVPVGVFYTDFTRFNEELHVRYGKPVYLQHYKELYRKNPQKAYNVVKSTVAKRIIPMMINI
ncbi:MAG: 1-acyl-sn-glycerol-3-phosphate acyltransferase, partial [Bacteroidales bacterium]|nr:1-acyl-sn-glycerol-3-phosphate acyltransferase [Bacteroidales bacterium]